MRRIAGHGPNGSFAGCYGLPVGHVRPLAVHVASGQVRALACLSDQSSRFAHRWPFASGDSVVLWRQNRTKSSQGWKARTPDLASETCHRLASHRAPPLLGQCLGRMARGALGMDAGALRQPWRRGARVQCPWPGGPTGRPLWPPAGFRALVALADKHPKAAQAERQPVERVFVTP